MKNPIRSWVVGMTAVAAVAAVGSQWLQGPESTIALQQPVAGSNEKAFVQPEAIPELEADRDQLQEIKRLADELAALRTQLSRLSQDQVVMRQHVDSLPESMEAEPEMDPMGVQAEEQAETRMWQQQAVLEDNLRNEELDEEWAQETLVKIEEGFHHEELAGVHLIDAACGSTLCQVDLSIDSELPVDEGMQRLSIHRPWDGPTFFSMSADGIARLYFARDGYDLPQIPEEPDLL